MSNIVCVCVSACAVEKCWMLAFISINKLSAETSFKSFLVRSILFMTYSFHEVIRKVKSIRKREKKLFRFSCLEYISTPKQQWMNRHLDFSKYSFVDYRDLFSFWLWAADVKLSFRSSRATLNEKIVLTL